METATPTPEPGDEIDAVLKVLRCARGWPRGELERSSGIPTASVSAHVGEGRLAEGSAG